VSASKRKGSAWEVQLRDHLAQALDRACHRLALSGTRDIGDIAVEGVDITIEAKACKALDLGGWMNELAIEQRHRATRWAALIVKRRSHSVGRAYVVMELDQWCDLVDAAHWRPDPPTPIHRPNLAVVRHPPSGASA
jgi:hypothetical protein